MSRCDSCGRAPRWIYNVGNDELCGMCCANQLAEARAKLAMLQREALDVEQAAEQITLETLERARDMLRAGRNRRSK